MLAFLKKWRQAYLDEKGDRLHAEALSCKSVSCDDHHSSLSQHLGAFLSASAIATEEVMEEERLMEEERYY